MSESIITKLNIVQTRLMNQRKLVNTSVPHQRIYSGSIDCFLQVTEINMLFIAV